MSKILLVVLLGLGCIVGVLMSAIRLPGVWLIVGLSLFFGFLSNWTLIGVQTVLWVAGLALLAEILEFAMSAVTTRRAGGSSRAAWGALIGGFLGLIFLSIPLPVVGSIIGAIAGCFIGAVVGELAHQGMLSQKSLHHGTRVGVFAAIGFALGTAVKVGIALIMSVLAVAALIGAEWPKTTAPTTTVPSVAPSP